VCPPYFQNPTPDLPGHFRPCNHRAPRPCPRTGR
jgi:hypothetical protein